MVFVLTVARSAAAQSQDVAPPIEEEGKSNDKMRLSAQVGGSWSTGNTKAYAANSQARFAIRRGNNQLTWSGVANYSRATASPASSDPDAEETTYVADSLWYTRARYDRFVLEKSTVFVGGQFFRDSGSGFRARAAGDVGVTRTLFATEPFELYAEAGFRLMREWLLLDRAAREDGLPTQRWLYSPTLAVGTVINLNETLNFEVGAEGLYAVNNKGDFRMFGFASLINRIGKGFALGMNFNLRYVRMPIGDREPLDSQLQLVLIGDATYDSKKKK